MNSIFSLLLLPSSLPNILPFLLFLLFLLLSLFMLSSSLSSSSLLLLRSSLLLECVELKPNEIVPYFNNRLVLLTSTLKACSSITDPDCFGKRRRKEDERGGGCGRKGGKKKEEVTIRGEEGRKDEFEKGVGREGLEEKNEKETENEENERKDKDGWIKKEGDEGRIILRAPEMTLKLIRLIECFQWRKERSGWKSAWIEKYVENAEEKYRNIEEKFWPAKNKIFYCKEMMMGKFLFPERLCSNIEGEKTLLLDQTLFEKRHMEEIGKSNEEGGGRKRELGWRKEGRVRREGAGDRVIVGQRDGKEGNTDEKETKGGKKVGEWENGKRKYGIYLTSCYIYFQKIELNENIGDFRISYRFVQNHEVTIVGEQNENIVKPYVIKEGGRGIQEEEIKLIEGEKDDENGKRKNKGKKTRTEGKGNLNCEEREGTEEERKRSEQEERREVQLNRENKWMVIDWYEQGRMSKEELFMKKIKVNEKRMWVFYFLSFFIGFWGFLIVSTHFWLSLMAEIANMLVFWLIWRRTMKLKFLYGLIVSTFGETFIL